MRLLLDTQAFLWWVNGSPPLPAKAARALADPANELLLSVASCWEIAIKASLGKLRLPQPPALFIPAQLQENAITLLEISFAHTAAVAELPFHHRDPFDRIIAVQARAERIPLVGGDAVFSKYGVKRIWR